MEEVFNFRETVINNISYVCPTWNELGRMSFELSKDIIESNKNLESIVILANGAFTWAKTTGDNLEIENILATRYRSYDSKEVNKRGDIRKIYDIPLSIEDQSILLFDDVADSGKTLLCAREDLIKLGAKDIVTATLGFKPRFSCVKPDFYGFETESWIVFPHEYREFIKKSCIMWSSNGIENGEIRGRFLDIGLPENQVDFFMSRAGFEIK